MPATGSLQLVEAVIEHFECAPVGKRRRWSDKFKAQAVTATLEPGLSVSALARRLGITPPQLFGWRKAFLKKQEADISAVTQHRWWRSWWAGTQRCSAAPDPACGAIDMMPAVMKIYLAIEPVDFRKGPHSLMLLVRDAGSDPFSGALYVFQAKRANRQSYRIPRTGIADRVSVVSTVWPSAARP